MIYNDTYLLPFVLTQIPALAENQKITGEKHSASHRQHQQNRETGRHKSSVVATHAMNKGANV